MKVLAYQIKNTFDWSWLIQTASLPLSSKTEETVVLTPQQDAHEGDQVHTLLW